MRLNALTLAFPFAAALVMLFSCGSNQQPEHKSELTLEAALAQLKALPLPPGTERIQFDGLRNGLRQQLADYGSGKWSSAAPADPVNRVADLYLVRLDDATAEARWTYRNAGDYDQNGEVNIADVSMLGANLGRSIEDSDWYRARVADGDRNLEINISDLTPLGSHLLRTVDAYSIQVTTNLFDEGSWSEIAQVSLSTATPASDGPRKFAANVTAAAGQNFRVVPLHGGLPGIAGTPYSFDGIGGAPEMDPVLRQLVLDKIGEKLGNLVGSTSEEQDAELAGYISGLPGIADVFHQGGSISAEFEDGRIAAVFKNRQPAEGPESQSHSSAANGPARRASGDVALEHLPSDPLALLFNSFTADEPHNVPAGEIAQMLSAKNYQPLQIEGTLEAYANVGPAGLLYIDGHGAIAHGKDGPFSQMLVVTTTTVHTRANEILLAQELDSGQLVYGVIPTISGTHSEQRYCFSEHWIRAHNWQLAEDSVVFLNTCESGSPAAYGFRQALSEVGAQTLFGWTPAVPDNQANEAALEFFDNALGLDMYKPSEPPQRPFPLGSVLDDLRNRTVAVVILRPTNPALLQRYGNGILAPTIRLCRTFESEPGVPEDSIQVIGDFGPEPNAFSGFPGTVLMVGGVELPIIEPPSWESQRLLAVLPTSGAGSSGDVVVGRVLNGATIYSNAAKLTSWTGSITVKDAVTRTGATGTMNYSVEFKPHLRMDVRRTRNKPGETPAWQWPGPYGEEQYWVRNSTATYDASGSWTYSGDGTVETHTLDGDGELEYFSDRLEIEEEPHVTGSFFMDLDAGTLTLSGSAPVLFAWTTDGPSGHTEGNAARGLLLSNADGSPLTIALDGSYNLLADEVNFSYDNAGEHHSITIEWETFAAEHAPTADNSL
ncbi:MAG: hypothetical protein M3R04_05120 [bacterium]|nr:hypothetical protein [bacterium]